LTHRHESTGHGSLAAHRTRGGVVRVARMIALLTCLSSSGCMALEPLVPVWRDRWESKRASDPPDRGSPINDNTRVDPSLDPFEPAQRERSQGPADNKVRLESPDDPASKPPGSADKSQASGTTEPDFLPPLPPLPGEPTPAPSSAAQAAKANMATEVVPAGESAAPMDSSLVPATCPSCGGVILGGAHGHPPMFGAAVCPSGGCLPGRKPSYPLPADSFLGRFFGNIYQALCCPDPCYQPRWIPEANAAYFLDYARPQTLTRLRVDYGNDFQLPDRSEYFWSRSDGKGRGPTFPKFGTKTPAGKTPARPVPKGFYGLNYGQLSLYQEMAANRASFFIEIPYRSVGPYSASGHAGFSDMNLGTKSLLLDTELLQLTFQFKTYLPIGSSTTGLGTGHVSLEPSLLSTLRLAPSTYLQGQLSEWIPLGGDPGFQGAMIHYHTSLNQVLCRVTPDSPLIGTLEFNGWTFQDGGYTSPVTGKPQRATGDSYFSVGPGLRMVICTNVDFGVGVAFALSDPHWEAQLYRFELRWLY
jgi:hypothetical protein